MTGGKPANMSASVRQKLLNLAGQTGDDPNLLWTRYGMERLLYRLSVSEFAKDFILKGAALFAVWSGEMHRPTMDLDLLGFGEDSNARIEGIFLALCRLKVEDDGLTFDEKSIRVIPIREDLEYQGRRVNLVAHLGKARIPVQVDIGFGDAVTPRATQINYPTLLDMPAPRIRACPQPTVIAEKFHAMVARGIANSRMKDFYDLHTLATHFNYDGAILVKAVKATFQRRKTEIPLHTPIALTEAFAHDKTKTIQWNAFIRKIGMNETAPPFPEILRVLREFLLPVMNAAAGQKEIPGQWAVDGPWNS